MLYSNRISLGLIIHHPERSSGTPVSPALCVMRSHEPLVPFAAFQMVGGDLVRRVGDVLEHPAIRTIADIELDVVIVHGRVGNHTRPFQSWGQRRDGGAPHPDSSATAASARRCPLRLYAWRRSSCPSPSSYGLSRAMCRFSRPQECLLEWNNWSRCDWARHGVSSRVVTAFHEKSCEVGHVG